MNPVETIAKSAVAAIEGGDLRVTVIPTVGMGSVAGHAAGELADGRRVLCIVASGSGKRQLEDFFGARYPDRPFAGYGSALANIGLATIADTRKFEGDLLDTFDAVVFDEIYPSQHAYISIVATHFLNAGKPIIHVKGVGQPGLFEDGPVFDLRANAASAMDVPFRRSAEEIESLIDDTAKSLEDERRAYGILFDNKVVDASLSDFLAWVRSHNGMVSRIAADTIGDEEIVTEFLAGRSRRHDGSAIAQFETYVGDGADGEVVATYHTIEEAREGHMRVVAEKFIAVPTP